MSRVVKAVRKNATVRVTAMIRIVGRLIITISSLLINELLFSRIRYRALGRRTPTQGAAKLPG